MLSNESISSEPSEQSIRHKFNGNILNDMVNNSKNSSNDNDEYMEHELNIGIDLAIDKNKLKVIAIVKSLNLNIVLFINNGKALIIMVHVPRLYMNTYMKKRVVNYSSVYKN